MKPSPKERRQNNKSFDKLMQEFNKESKERRSGKAEKKKKSRKKRTF